MFAEGTHPPEALSSRICRAGPNPGSGVMRAQSSYFQLKITPMPVFALLFNIIFSIVVKYI